jgi:hypothetical protein
MGNSLSEEERVIRKEFLNKTKNLNLSKLDIGDRNGSTGYLDFIKPDELGTNNIMKGLDCDLRSFFVFKAEFEYPNGLKKKTFTTFFQRYSDNELLWHCCGHYGPNLMYTEGGANNEQIKLLYELFSSGEYKINKDQIDEQRLNYRLNESYLRNDLTDNDYPINIKLGHSV